MVIYSVKKKTQHVLVINTKNSATCFGSLSHHQAKYKHITDTFSECTNYGIPYCLQNYIYIEDHVLFYYPMYLKNIYTQGDQKFSVHLTITIPTQMMS